MVRKNYTKNVVMFSFKAVTHKNVMIKIKEYPGKLATVETVASLWFHYTVVDDNVYVSWACAVPTPVSDVLVRQRVFSRADDVIKHLLRIITINDHCIV